MRWIVGSNRDGYFIDDQDFKYDGRLYINGDFPSEEAKREYAHSIAEKLNQQEELNKPAQAWRYLKWEPILWR